MGVLDKYSEYAKVLPNDVSRSKHADNKLAMNK